MDYETMIYETSSDGVATITLNRPDRLNAFNHAMGLEFIAIWRQIREDQSVRSIVLRAAGERAFSTGADVKDGGWVRSDLPIFDQTDPGPSLGPKQNAVWKPVVCAIHGLCAGGAFYWVNESDIVICSDDAQFFDPHVHFGMVSAVEPAGLIGRIHYGEIMRMVLLGNHERITAETALRIGLVTEITRRDQLWERAHELAAIIALKPAAAIQGSVRAFWESRDLPPSLAVKNAFKYPQLGNAFGRAEIDRATAPKAIWRAR